MSMTLILYDCADNNSKIDKELINPVTVTVRPTDGFDMDAPTIDIQYTQAALTKNYAKLTVGEYTAYYFINARAVYPAEKITLQMQIDILQTYADGIKNSYANVIRNAQRITHVHDDKLPIEPDRFTLHTEPLKENVFQYTGILPNYVAVINTAGTE